MKRIEFEVAGKRYGYDLPESWAEVTQEQFVIFAGGIGNDTEPSAPLMAKMIGLDDVVSVSLSLSDWWYLGEQLSFLRDLKGYKMGLMDTVTLSDGTVCYGFSDDFSDVTWEEWVYADSNAYAERWDVVAAVLYRPKKQEWDRKSDPREEFSRWSADVRLTEMRKLDKDILKAVALNYKLMRQQLTKRYGRLFVAGSSSDKKGGSPNLQTLIRNVMGDNFFEEEKYMKLTVPSVLFQLDRMVREAKERRRNG